MHGTTSHLGHSYPVANHACFFPWRKSSDRVNGLAWCDSVFSFPWEAKASCRSLQLQERELLDEHPVGLVGASDET